METKEMSIFTRAYCLSLAILFDCLHIEVIHNKPNSTSKEEVEKNIVEVQGGINRNTRFQSKDFRSKD